jgi:site-specific DNA-cytosine methylase
MQALSYEYQALYLNAMFCGVPQRRDRWFGVFWKKGAKRPDLAFHPAAFCLSCEEQVQAVQSWKRPTRKWGKYSYHPKSGQYVYRCPRCAREVRPYYRPAASVVDVTERGVKIRERKQHGLPPLNEKTMQRIQDGIDRFFKRPQPIPMEAIDVPAFDGPAPFWISYYSNGKSYSIYEPFCTFSTKERCGIVFPSDSGSLDIQECRYRMLNEREIRGGSGLPSEYKIKAETKEELVRQCGHMVPPPMAAQITQRVVAAI